MEPLYWGYLYDIYGALDCSFTLVNIAGQSNEKCVSSRWFYQQAVGLSSAAGSSLTLVSLAVDD